MSANVLLLSSLSEISTCIVGFLIVTVFGLSFVSDLLLELESSIINGFLFFKFFLSSRIISFCNSSVSSSESFFSISESIAVLFIFNNSSVSSSESWIINGFLIFGFIINSSDSDSTSSGSSDSFLSENELLTLGVLAGPSIGPGASSASSSISFEFISEKPWEKSSDIFSEGISSIADFNPWMGYEIIRDSNGVWSNV